MPQIPTETQALVPCRFRDSDPVWERFFDKVELPNATESCWEWRAYRNPAGYGIFYVADLHRLERAHRVCYEMLIGPIPEGATLDHLCKNPGCVNPRHMEPITMRENILRGDGPTAENARKTHCNKGHALTGHNLILERGAYGTQRRCRECHYAGRRRRYAAARAR